MAESSNNYYQTNVNVDPNTTIIALSNIYGDIHSLIISLRDCAKVIDSNITMDTLEEYLNINICDDDNGYDDTLTFKWIGGNTHVVIIGNIIDGKSTEPKYRFFEKYISDDLSIKEDELTKQQTKLNEEVNSINSLIRRNKREIGSLNNTIYNLKEVIKEKKML
jgi:hypothetical protein